MQDEIAIKHFDRVQFLGNDTETKGSVFLAHKHARTTVGYQQFLFLHFIVLEFSLLFHVWSDSIFATTCLAVLITAATIFLGH